MIILYDKYIYQRRFFPILFLFPFSSSIENTVFDHISKDMKFVKNAPLRIVFSILFSSFREFYVTYQTRKIVLLHLSVLNDISPHEPLLQASPRTRISSIKVREPL